MGRTLAYVDECGNSSLALEKKGASKYFVSVAVLIDEDRKGEAENLISQIAGKWFSGGEIKSSNIGHNDERRLKVLETLCRIDFKYVALFVDKSELSAFEGLHFKRSFYKFFAKKLFDRLNRGVYELVVLMDEMGTDDFKVSLKNYITKNQPMDLIYRYDFDVADSRNERLLQLADLVAGTFSRLFDSSFKCTRSQEMMKLLKPHQCDVILFPPGIGSKLIERPSKADSELDDAVSFVNMKVASLFVERYDGSKEDDRQMQLVVLRNLMMQAFSDDGTEGQLADALIRAIVSNGYPRLERQAFMSRIIGPLRDAGIVLSGTNVGFRLAMTMKDVYNYVDHVSGTVEPMLGRLEIARRQVTLATATRYDFLTEAKYRNLKNILASLSEAPSLHEDSTFMEEILEGEADPGSPLS